MMNALTRSMPCTAVYSPDFEDFNPEIEGWRANPNGLWEVGLLNYLNAEFLRGIPADGLVKILFDGLVNLPVAKHKHIVIFMTRDPEEIRASLETVDKKLDQYATESGLVRNKSEDPIPALPFSCFRDYNQADIDHVLSICRQRLDIDLVEIDFKDLIKDPEWVFERIAHTPLGKKRLKLDIKKAVSAIDPKLHRERNEVREGQI